MPTGQLLAPLGSRIHSLNSFGPNCFIKRDDELSFGISGSKLRKYASFLPKFLQAGFTGIVAIGGSHANNLVALGQLCNEHRIDLRIVALGPPHQPKGNNIILSLLVPATNITWLNRKEWHQNHEVATALATKLSDKHMVLPEGGSHPWCREGCVSLLDEIQDFELQHHVFFDEIVLDAGTGFTSQTLLAEAYKRTGTRRKFIIIHMASHSSQEHVSDATPLAPHRIMTPSVGKSFGATPAKVFVTIREIAQKEGILCDPIYSGKLFLTVRDLPPPSGYRLLIHSGGGLALTGFMDRLMGN